VTTREQEKQLPSNREEFFTLGSTIVRDGNLSLNHADISSAAVEFCNFRKELKETEADKVHELILEVVSDPLQEASSEGLSLTCHIKHANISYSKLTFFFFYVCSCFCCSTCLPGDPAATQV